jgi:predicted N-acetyltransferase YhbS
MPAVRPRLLRIFGKFCRRVITLAPLSTADPDAVEALLDAAFGRDRHGRTAYRLRAGVTPIEALSFAAFAQGRLIGSLQSWPLELAPADAAPCPLVLVGPVAVEPERQRDGIGKRLMQALLAAADASDPAPALAMIGDPEYYGRFFGFTAEATGGWEVPGPVERRRLLARIPAGRALPATGLLRPRIDTLAALR